jgi:hypothetical protein
MPNPAIATIAALAGSGTLDCDRLELGKETPLAAAKASKAARSPAEAAPLSPPL